MPPDPLGSSRLWRSKSRLLPTFPVETSTSKLIDSTVCIYYFTLIWQQILVQHQGHIESHFLVSMNWQEKENFDMFKKRSLWEILNEEFAPCIQLHLAPFNNNKNSAWPMVSCSTTTNHSHLKPWPNGPASSRKWSQVELAQRLDLCFQTDSEVSSQVPSSRKKKKHFKADYFNLRSGFQIYFQAWVSIPNSNGSIPSISTKSLLIFYQFVVSCRWPCRVFDLRPLAYLDHCVFTWVGWPNGEKLQGSKLTVTC